MSADAPAFPFKLIIAAMVALLIGLSACDDGDENLLELDVDEDVFGDGFEIEID